MEAPQKLRALWQTVLAEGAHFTLPGRWRAALAAQSGAAGGGSPPSDSAVAELPAELLRYADKVARHAYRVTDEDVAGLLGAGHSEEAVFEATIATALGAGWARMEAALRALRSAPLPKERS